MIKYLRILCLFLSLFTLFLWTGGGIGEAAASISITVDGLSVETDVPPFIDQNGRTMVPVRFVSEALGCVAGWNSEQQKVKVSRPGTTVELFIGNKTAAINGTAKEMDTTAILKEGRTMVPLRFLAETFGLNVNWQQEQRTVAIKSPVVTPQKPTSETRVCFVTGDIVNIRSGPGIDFDRLTQVTEGARLTVLAEGDEWFQVEVPGGVKGWIAGWLVSFQESMPAPPPATLSGIYAAPSDLSRFALIMKDSVNVRTSSGVGHPIIAKVSAGQQLEIIGERNDWFNVRLPNEQTGWIAGWLAAVRYEAGQQQSEGTTRVASLISRWNAGVHNIDNELPAVLSVEAERSGNGVLLKVNADSTLSIPSSFRLDNPSRLVFDFPGHLGEDTAEPVLQVNHGSVHRFRVGQFDETTVRVVADLQGPASYAIVQNPDNKTITIQIQPVDPSRQIIVIDPGHGALNAWDSSDPGAIGPGGVRERDVVRSISLQLGNILLNEGYTVIYTNENDTGLTLEERAAVASVAGAELLVSIHANASTNRAMAGTMTFYHAARGTSQANQINDRRKLAGLIQAELVNRLQREDKGIREANFLVLRSCPIPAALVEVAFISNPEEERLLADAAFQRRAAEAIALGIKRYLSQK